MDNQTTVNVNKKLLWLILGIILTAVIAVFLNYFKIISLPNNLPLISKLPVSKPVPGSCKILEEKYCKNAAERTTIKGARNEFIYLTFKDIPTGTPIYAPSDGFFTFSNELGTQFVGYNVGISTPDEKNPTGGVIIRGAMRINNTTQRAIKAGEIIGYKENGKTFDNRYDLLFTMTKVTESGTTTDENSLKQLSPKAFEKPLIINSQSPDKPNSTAVFSVPSNAQPAH